MSDISFIRRVEIFFRTLYYWMKGNPEKAMRNDRKLQKKIDEFQESKEKLINTLERAADPENYDDETDYGEGNETWTDLVEEIFLDSGKNYNLVLKRCIEEERIDTIDNDTNMDEFKSILERYSIG